MKDSIMKLAKRNSGFLALAAMILFAAATSAGKSPAVRYVDGMNGRDADNGSLKSPWRTLQYAADSTPETGVIFVRAGTYRETVRPRNGQRFAAYEGEKPLVAGDDPVLPWEHHSGEIYRARAESPVLDVFVHGKAMPRARFPSCDGDPLTTDNWLPTENTLESQAGKGVGKVRFLEGMGEPDGYWVGGWYSGINGRNPFMAHEGRITASAGNELSCTDLSPRWIGVYGSDPGQGVGYITDHLNCLDSENEWHWEDGTLYFWAPGGGKPKGVTARVRIHGFIVKDRRNVRLEGLYFQGASVWFDGGRGNVIDGCHFRRVSPWSSRWYRDEARQYGWGGPADGTSGIHIAGDDHTIRNSSVVGGWGMGIHLAGGSNLTVENNYVADFGWSARFNHAPIMGFGDGLNIRHNTIRRAPGAGIFLLQKNPGDGSNVNHVKRPLSSRPA